MEPDDNDDESTVVGGPDSPKLISRNYLPVSSAVTRDHTIKVYGDRAHGKSEEEIKKWLDKLENARKGARSWCNFQCTKVMLEEAARQGLRATAMGDLYDLWKADDSDEMGKKMWEVAYGVFDRQPYWYQDLEEEYMKLMNWEYPPRPASLHARCKSCLSLIFCHVKNDLVKNLNRAVSVSRGGHGRTVRIARFKEDLTDVNRRDRRRKGKFSEWMLTGKAKNTKKKTRVETEEISPPPAMQLLEEDISPMSFKGGKCDFLPGISVEEEEVVEEAMMTPKTKKLLQLQVRTFAIFVDFILILPKFLFCVTETNEGPTERTRKDQSTSRRGDAEQ